MKRRRFAFFPLVPLALAAGAGSLWWNRARPLRFPEYSLDLTLPDPARASRPLGALRVGVASANVTPEVGPNARPVWLAGFGHGRRATSVHDPLFARALVLDDGRLRVGIVALDLVGLHHDDVILMRRALPASLGLDHLIVACTHNHEGPDTMGMWGRHILASGVDPAYMARLRRAVVETVEKAAAALVPARLVAAEADLSADDLIRDSRPPKVIDARLLALRFEGDSGAAIATLVVWSDHPETLGEGEAITSDFPHYVRRAIEREGGGVCVYLSGSIGGLMTPLGHKIRGPDGRVFEGESFEKAEALGEAVARRAREALFRPDALRPERPAIALRARLFDVPATNRLYWAAMKLGIVERGLAPGDRVRTEVGALRIGPVALALVPGELYPEIAAGGVESPDGADFPGEPAERPPLRELLRRRSPQGGLGAIVGLANDEIGYIIPRTEWDTRAPYSYGQKEAPYGEINSLGPEAGPALYGAIAKAIEELPE
jgi:hypothetical protein